MIFTTAQIAELVGGKVEGNPDMEIRDLAGLDQGREGTLSFLYDARYTHHLYSTESSAVIVEHGFEATEPLKTTLIRVDSPYAAFNRILTLHAQNIAPPTGIHPQALISSKANIAPDAYIGPFVQIEDDCDIESGTQIHTGCVIGKGSFIGKDSCLFPHVVLYANTKLGQRCIVHAQTVIGSDGFGFLKNEALDNVKIPQVGTVQIGDDVEIGANCCIDRSTLGVTFIANNVKIDNLVHIAHNVSIGERTLIAAQAGISGGVQLGKDCVVGGQTGFVGHLKIAEGSQFGGQSGVNRSIEEPNRKWRGAPALELGKQQRVDVLVRRLPELLNRIEELEKQLALLSSSQPLES